MKTTKGMFSKINAKSKMVFPSFRSEHKFITTIKKLGILVLKIVKILSFNKLKLILIKFVA